MVTSSSLNPLGWIQTLVGLVLGKFMPVVAGKSACTDLEKIFLPPTIQGDTDRAKIRALCLTLHEVWHNKYNSIIYKLTHKYAQLLFKFVNGFEDIRIERKGEAEYAGARDYFRLFYLDMMSEYKAYYAAATLKGDVVAFLKALNRYNIMRNRGLELGITLKEIPASSELIGAYDKYLADLEPRTNAMKSCNDAKALAEEYMRRVEKLIEDQLTQQAQQKKQEQQKKQKQQEEEQDGNDSGDDSQDSDGECDDSSEDAPGSDRDDQGKSEDAGDDDSDTAGDDESDGSSASDGDDSEEESAGKSDGDSGADDDASGSDTDERDADSKSGEESGAGSDDDAGDDSDRASGGKGDTDSEDKSADGDDESTDKADDDGDEAVKASDDDEEPLPKLAQKELDEIKKAVEQKMNEFNEDEDELNEFDQMKKDLEDDFACSNEYIKDPSVKDVIVKASSYSGGERFRDAGIKLLGQEAADMARLFVNNTRPHKVRFQKRGRLDFKRLADPRDGLDVYTKTYRGILEQSAVMLVKDNSSSMSSGNRDITASNVLSGLLYHLDRAAVPCSACGYTDLYIAQDSMGRAICSSNGLVRDYPVRVEIYKEFDETYTAEVMNRIRPSVISNNTPEFDCVREYAVPALMARREERKILFIICDGEPNCQNSDLSYRMAATYKRYIRALKAEGIKVFGFGIGAYLQDFFEDDWMCVNTSTLGKEMIDKLTVILNRKE